jgi:hypothetical protein
MFNANKLKGLVEDEDETRTENERDRTRFDAWDSNGSIISSFRMMHFMPFLAGFKTYVAPDKVSMN